MNQPVISLRRKLFFAITAMLALGGSLATATGEASDGVDIPVPVDPVPASRAATVESAGTIAIPVAGVLRDDLRDTFGAPRGPARVHQAIDILSDRGTPVLAAIDGSVLKLYESAAGGQTIYLVDEARETIYYYAHLDRYAPGIDEGDFVEQGEVIGYVGTSGNAPDDVPHLHFSIERLPSTGEWWKGEPMNPYPILMGRGFSIE